MKPRVRFAPSPTGYLHIGGARTALFNWLYARHTGRTFVLRSDGQPVFHFVNVVDDLEMGITHVIRGEDHLSNTAKHIALFRAFGVEPPKYAHIPLILNGDGSKMSKRDKGASLTTYLDEGFAPEAVANYLCLLGWSPKNNREKVPIEE